MSDQRDPRGGPLDFSQKLWRNLFNLFIFFFERATSTELYVGFLITEKCGKHAFNYWCVILRQGVDFINFLRPIRALHPTFEKLFTGVQRALRRAPNFDRAISMICALRPTFMKSTQGHLSKTVRPKK